MTVPELLYKRAIEAGFTSEAACALLANIQGESAFRSDNAEDRIHAYGISDAEYVRRADSGELTYNGKNFIYDAVGFGYAQWTYWSRKKLLLEYCQNRGRSVADADAQTEFIFYEMSRDFPGIYELCKTSHDINTLMHQLIWVWENPYDKQGAMFERMSYAQAWIAKFSGWDSLVTPATPTTPAEPAPVDTPAVDITWPPRSIDEGLNWNETYLLQSLLLCKGYQVVVNGIFNSSLTEKVKEFQSVNGLVADGIVGKKSWKKLMELPTNY